MVRPALKRPVVDYIVSHYGTSQRRACKVDRQHRSLQRYRSIKDPRLALRQRMREISQVRVRLIVTGRGIVITGYAAIDSNYEFGVARLNDEYIFSDSFE